MAMKQITIRRALTLLALLSVGLAIYCSIRKESTHNQLAASMFAPMHHKDGIAFSATQAHAKLLSEMDVNRFKPIDSPEWTVDLPMETKEQRKWEPQKSDWFVVDDNGTKNYVHVASHGQNGFMVNVWTRQQIMLHQDESSAYTDSLDQKLQFQLISELSQKYINLFNVD